MNSHLAPEVLEYLSYVRESLLRFSNGVEDLGGMSVEDLWVAPFALLSHNTQAPPRFVYSNAKALEAFETNWEEWIGRPSRESAEEDEREAREKLLKDVEERGFSDGYSGVRISVKGNRFMIKDALLWNVEKDGERIGQAAMFPTWERIPSFP